MSAHLRQLPYRRILCLVLAAAQLFPLPELFGEPSGSSIVPLVRVFPEFAQA